MMDRKAEPEIRFKGFTDSWEQRKLGDVCVVRMGQSPDGATYSDTPSNYILVQGNADLKDGWVFPRIWTTQKTKTAQAGDLIMSVRAPAGAMGKTAYDVVLGRGVAGIKGNEFIYQALVKMNSEGYWKKLAAGSTFESVNSDAVKNAEILVPQDVEEQAKIGNYFRNLDNLITLHQRKCDKLCDFKKALLCNMFPAAEADAPKVRFKGYTKPWKHWTLGELYTERKEAGNDDLPILSVSIHSGVSADELDSAELGKAVRRSEDKSLYKHTYKGDLVFNMMRAWQGAIGVVPKEGMVSPAYITAIPNDEVFPEFMDYCLRREEVINQINNLSYGVTDFRKRLYWDSFVRVQIMLPSVEEQKKITATLVQLDELIELQSAKVERLKNLKAACLEKMFV